ISSGLGFAATLFNISGMDSDRRTIDVSGDGANNDGPSLTPVRDSVVRQGININGLPILLDPTPTFSSFGRVPLQDYYEDCVIGGPGASSLPITDLKVFAPAIRRKLILEIATLAPQTGIVPVVDADRPKVDCALAETFRSVP